MGMKGFRLADDQGAYTVHMLCGYFRDDEPPKIHAKGSLRTTTALQALHSATTVCVLLRNTLFADEVLFAFIIQSRTIYDPVGIWSF